MAVVELLETPLSKGPEYAYLRERILEGGCCGALAPVPNTRSPVEFGAWSVDVPIACKDDTTKGGTTTVATDNAVPRPGSPGSWRGRSKHAGLPTVRGRPSWLRPRTIPAPGRTADSAGCSQPKRPMMAGVVLLAHDGRAMVGTTRDATEVADDR
jgi:hypothetical protein